MISFLLWNTKGKILQKAIFHAKKENEMDVIKLQTGQEMSTEKVVTNKYDLKMSLSLSLFCITFFIRKLCCCHFCKLSWCFYDAFILFSTFHHTEKATNQQLSCPTEKRKSCSVWMSPLSDTHFQSRSLY